MCGSRWLQGSKRGQQGSLTGQKAPSREKLEDASKVRQDLLALGRPSIFTFWDHVKPFQYFGQRAKDCGTSLGITCRKIQDALPGWTHQRTPPSEVTGGLAIPSLPLPSVCPTCLRLSVPHGQLYWDAHRQWEAWTMAVESGVCASGGHGRRRRGAADAEHAPVFTWP